MRLDVSAEIWPIFDEPLHAMLKPGKAINQLRVQRFDSEKRDQSDERPNLERIGLSIRKMQHVIEESIFLVPELDFFPTDVVHGSADVDEVLKELARHIFVGPIITRQLQCDRKHIQAIHPHPTCRIRLFDMTTGRQGRAPIKDPNVVEAQKPTLKDILPLGIFSIDPPRKVQEQLMEHSLEENPITDSSSFFFDLIDSPCSPGMNRRVDVAKRPLICRNLTVRVHVPFSQHQNELFFGKG